MAPRTVPLETQLRQEQAAEAVTAIEQARPKLRRALVDLDLSGSREFHVRLAEFIEDLDDRAAVLKEHC